MDLSLCHMSVWSSALQEPIDSLPPALLANLSLTLLSCESLGDDRLLLAGFSTRFEEGSCLFGVVPGCAAHQACSGSSWAVRALPAQLPEPPQASGGQAPPYPWTLALPWLPSAPSSRPGLLQEVKANTMHPPVWE